MNDLTLMKAEQGLINNSETIMPSTLEEPINRLETAKFAAESALQEEQLDVSIVRSIAAALGVFILIDNLVKLFKNPLHKLRNIEISKLVINFVVAGALIGYTFKNLVVGMEIGLVFSFLLIFGVRNFIRIEIEHLEAKRKQLIGERK